MSRSTLTASMAKRRRTVIRSTMLLAAVLLAWWLERGGLCLALLVVPLGVTILQTLWSCRLLLRQAGEMDDPLELRVPRELLAELYEMVEEVASARGSPMPDEMRLAVDRTAAAFEDKHGRRVLILGGAVLMPLSGKAHELGHFAAGDTRWSRVDLSRVFMMGRLEDDFALKRLLRWNPFIWVLRGYHRLCFLAWAADSREREFRADRHLARQVGKKQAAAALVFTAVADRLPWVRLASIAESFVVTGQPLADLFAEQRQRLKSISASEWEEAFRKELALKTERSDSHPCLRERLKAIGVSPKKALAFALEQSGPPVAERLSAWPGIEKILSRRTMAMCREYHQMKMEMAQIILGWPFLG